MSLSPLIIGHEGGAWWDSGVCWAPIAGAAAPKVKPPANAAPLLSSALRFSGFEPMRLSFADEANEEIACGREYTPISASVLAIDSGDMGVTLWVRMESPLIKRARRCCDSHRHVKAAKRLLLRRTYVVADPESLPCGQVATLSDPQATQRRGQNHTPDSHRTVQEQNAR